MWGILINKCSKYYQKIDLCLQNRLSDYCSLLFISNMPILVQANLVSQQHHHQQSPKDFSTSPLAPAVHPSLTTESDLSRPRAFAQATPLYFYVL